MPTGSAILDFGTRNSEASVAVTGQAAFAANSFVSAYMQGNDTTTDHSEDEHMIEELDIICSDFVAGTGFTIRATCRNGTTLGQYDVRWVWV